MDLHFDIKGLMNKPEEEILVLGFLFNDLSQVMLDEGEISHLKISLSAQLTRFITHNCYIQRMLLLSLFLNVPSFQVVGTFKVQVRRKK